MVLRPKVPKQHRHDGPLQMSRHFEATGCISARELARIAQGSRTSNGEWILSPWSSEEILLWAPSNPPNQRKSSIPSSTWEMFRLNYWSIPAFSFDVSRSYCQRLAEVRRFLILGTTTQDWLDLVLGDTSMKTESLILHKTGCKMKGII